VALGMEPDTEWESPLPVGNDQVQAKGKGVQCEVRGLTEGGC